MWQHKIDVMNSVDHLRSLPVVNPECRQHMDQIAQCIVDAFAAYSRVYDVKLDALQHTLKQHEDRIAKLERLLWLTQKQNLTAPGAAGAFAVPPHSSEGEMDPQQPLN